MTPLRGDLPKMGRIRALSPCIPARMRYGAKKRGQIEAMMSFPRILSSALALAMCLGLATPFAAQAQNGPLRIEITEGVIEPLPFAVPDFVAENGAATDYAREIARVIASDLSGTGLFREIPSDAHISRVSSDRLPMKNRIDWYSFCPLGIQRRRRSFGDFLFILRSGICCYAIHVFLRLRTTQPAKGTFINGRRRKEAIHVNRSFTYPIALLLFALFDHSCIF